MNLQKFEDSYILHNTSNKQLKRAEYINELNQFKTKCGQCKTIVQKVRSLLNEIRDLRENEVKGVCEYCKRVSLNRTCKRCEFIVSKFISTNQIRSDEKQQRFKIWLCKVKHLLQEILDAESVCQYKVYKDTDMERILHALKTPLPSMREPGIDIFPTLDLGQPTSLKSLSENKQKLQELLAKIKFEGEKHFSLDNSLCRSPSKESCICKYLKEGHFGGESSGFGTEKIELTKDAALTDEGGLFKDLGKMLSHEVYKQLLNRLLDLSKALPQGLHLNQELIQKLIKTLNIAINQGLSIDIVKKLIQELKELNETLPHDFSKGLNSQILQGLINDLSDLLKLGPPKDLNKNLIQLLLNLSELLNDVISKGSTKELSQIISKSVHKGTTQVTSPLSKHTNKQLLHLLAKLSKSLAKSDINKELIEELSRGINKALSHGSPLTELIKKITQELADLCRFAPQGIAKNANTERIQSLIKDTSKALAQRLSKEKNRKVIHGLLRDRQLSTGLPKKIGQKLLKSKHVDYKDKQVSVSDDDVIKNSTKSGKMPPKEKSLMIKTSTEAEMKSSSKQKENRSPADEKEIRKVLKEDHSKLKQTSMSDGTQKSIKQSYLFLRMLRDNKNSSEKHKLNKERELVKQRESEDKELVMRKLPKLKNKVIKQVTDEISERIVVCDVKQPRVPKYMIRGNKIVPYNRHSEAEVDVPVEPLVCKTQIDFAEPVISRRSVSVKAIPTLSESKQRRSPDNIYRDGVVRYRLSDKQFIDNGWTQLPIKKIMRLMNIYRMVPVNPQYGWFERHKQDRQLFYSTGDILADIDEDGRGHWYYRNGAIALDYYNAQEPNVGQRYIVYSSGEETDSGKLKQRTVLAIFDVLGNGVVYDHYGNVRLKYNQSEGLIVDTKLGAPGRWKWHTLNDPPVFQNVFINASMEKRDPKLELVPKPGETTDANEHFYKKPQPEMLSIEFDNFVKAKAQKILQKFKPFQIRMKAVKLNEKFSLKILDQANIYLLFRDGVTSLKLNLGLLLISNEIIGNETSDIADVATPYDKHPPKSVSVENIQKILKTVRSGKLRPPSEAYRKVSS